MSVLCSVVLPMSYISQLEIVHSTLNMSDIVIDSQGICKIISPVLSKHQFDFTANKDTYYAPETLKIFKMQAANNALTNKSAVFTLGMTILSMVHLSSLSHLYDFHVFSLNMEQVNRLVSEVRDRDLRHILGKMLKVHSYERIMFTELEEMLEEVVKRS